MELSTVVPACDLICKKRQEKALEDLKKVETDREVLLKKPSSLSVGNVTLGRVPHAGPIWNRGCAAAGDLENSAVGKVVSEVRYRHA